MPQSLRATGTRNKRAASFTSENIPGYRVGALQLSRDPAGVLEECRTMVRAKVLTSTQASMESPFKRFDALGEKQVLSMLAGHHQAHG